MKMNHICLIAGIILLIISMTVFAHATAITLDCTNPFDCEVKSYCVGVNDIPALLGAWGNCGPSGTQCDYPFTSSTVGTHSCSVTVKTTGYGNGTGATLQNNEVVAVRINGTLIGTTIDKYANTPSPPGTVWCGIDSQTFTKQVQLNASNTIDIHPEDSLGVVSVLINCQLVGRNCADNAASYPSISSIEDQSISYLGEFNLDLYDYISDPYDSYSQMTISMSTTGNSVNCSLDSNRYLTCTANGNIGDTTVTVSVENSCDHIATKTFNVSVTNHAPTVFVSDMQKSCVSPLGQLVNLNTYSWDENVSSATYTITSQTDTNLVNCYIDNSHYVSCFVNSCSEACSTVGLRVTDEFGLTGDDSFKLCFNNSTPTWTTLPSTCINKNDSHIINFSNYATDFEDKSNLTYTIDSQSNTSAVNCSIHDSNYLSCTLQTNQHLSSTLTIKATDNGGKYTTTQMVVNTNCYDGNGDDTNDGSGLIFLEATDTDVCLEKCTSYGTQMKLTNNSLERKCFSFDSESNHNDLLKTSVSNSNVCLNSMETTYLTLGVNTCGSEDRDYTVRVYDRDSNVELSLDFEVGSSCSNFDGFKIEEFDGKVCRGEEKSLTVNVTNKTNDEKRIYLSADNAFVLPYFEDDYVQLNGGQTKQVQLVINARNLPIDHYAISLSGDSENYHIEKRLDVEVVDCSNIAERTFVLSSPEICYDVKRGQSFESQFSINRLAGECCDCVYSPKNFFFEIYGMPSVISYNQVSLNAGDSKVINYTVTVPADAPVGHQLITLNAADGQEWNSYTEQKSICLNVLGEDKAGIVVKTQSKDITWCGTEIFEVELNNTGDFDANYTLSSSDVPCGVSVSFSEYSVTLKKHESKTIYVAVSTNPSSQVKDNQKFKIIVNGPVQLSAIIYFNIKEKTSFDDLEILSSSKQINTKGNSNATYDIVIRNNSDSVMNNVVVYVENMPKDVNFQTITINTLSPGEVTTVTGNIIIGDTNGYYESVFVVSSNGMVNKAPFAIWIDYNPKQSSSAGFNGVSGLFGAGFGIFGINFGGLLAIAFLAILLIVLVAVIILGIAAITKQKKREVWLAKEQ